MTTEQFLEHLGIEVGKPFNVKGYEQWQFRVVGVIVYCDPKEHSTRVFDCETLSWLLDKEVTPIPKYTLTEDEKAIVRLKFVGEYISLYRYVASGLLFVEVDGKDVVMLDKDLFTFIKCGKSLNIDELRKCL